MVSIRNCPHICNNLTLRKRRETPIMLEIALVGHWLWHSPLCSIVVGMRTLDGHKFIKKYLEFTTTYLMLMEGKQVLDFHLYKTLLHYLGHLCVPLRKCTKMIFEALYNRVARHFGVEKKVTITLNYFYWPSI